MGRLVSAQYEAASNGDIEPLTMLRVEYGCALYQECDL